jgi:hypothetical protein
MTQEKDSGNEPRMDWQQVALNGGPPCFYVEDGRYCGRAQRWAGHHGDPVVHEFVPLEYVTAKPMCPLHRRIEDKGDMDLEIGNDCLACSLNERAELLATLAAGTAADGNIDSVSALTALVNERDALLSEVAQLRAEALKGICVYCGYIEQYESLEQKASEAGNAMRVGHIRQCQARPEAKLIALSEQLIDEVSRLREALGSILQCFENGAMPDISIVERARAALAGKGRQR